MRAMGEECETYVGRTCFLQPHPLYVPPAFYERIPHREYRWKVSGKLVRGPGFRFKIERAIALPNCLGLGDDARWCWQWVPLSLLVGLKMDLVFHEQMSRENSRRGNYSKQGAWHPFYARIKLHTPIFGNFALQPMLELFPIPALSVKREFEFVGAKLMVRASFEAKNGFRMLDGRCWMLHVDWHPADTAMVRGFSVQGSFPIQYSRGIALTKDCKVVASAIAELPSDVVTHGVCRSCGILPVKIKFDSLKISQIIGTRSKRDPPVPTSSYLKAAKFIGKADVITVVPGHWIDPGVEVGASGERDFSLEVANVIERKLRGNGWEVLRPDRDAPWLSWEEYLNWVSKQTLKGVPVLEIHGQGSTADYRGLVLGVIGDAEAPLTKELASDFGYFQMDWRELGVPRRGGVVVESFNADEVLQLAPWHRKWAVRRLANRIVSSIERASFKNRTSRGVYVDLDPEDDLVKLDNVKSSKEKCKR